MKVSTAKGGNQNLISITNFRFLLGLLIATGGVILILIEVGNLSLWKNPVLSAALLGGSTAALATSLGTLPVLLSQKFSQKTFDGCIGFGAGIMLAATAFSLVIPAFTEYRIHFTAFFSIFFIGVSMLAGALFIIGLDKAFSSHVHKTFNAGFDISVHKTWLFVLAVALHNIPEGLAIGIAYGGNDIGNGNSLATGISLQDVPEGLVVALAIRGIGHSRWFAVLMGIASGLIEPVAAVAGVALVGAFDGLLPLALAGAAGAMLFVLCKDMIPESQMHGNRKFAIQFLIFGFIVMTLIDTALV